MVYRWLWMIVLAGLLVGCGSTTQSTEPLRGAVISPPRNLDNFTLMSTDGEPFSLDEHQGQVILLYFGYRSCPDFCPTTFAELKQVYSALEEPKDKLKIVFVTVDPERDTLENLTLYTHAFHEDFIGLRDDGEALKSLMAAFGVVAEKRQVGDSAMSYLIDHTASVFLIDAEGNFRVQFLYGTDYRDIVHDVRIVMQSA
ncbi:MAG: SCO family protein [Anaerolineae bacterium]|nr:SCO family protein [Anaerolineae bacterium]